MQIASRHISTIIRSCQIVTMAETDNNNVDNPTTPMEGVDTMLENDGNGVSSSSEDSPPPRLMISKMVRLGVFPCSFNPWHILINFSGSGEFQILRRRS